MSNTILQPGTLELYALGALSADECADAEQAIATDPDIRQELMNIEAGLEQFAAMQSRNPSPAVRARIMSETIMKTEASEVAASIAARSSSSMNFILAATACIAVLSTAALLYKWNDARADIDALRKENDKLAAMIDAETEKRHASDDLLAALKATDMATFKAVAANGKMKGHLYWNRTDNQAIFISLEPAEQLVASIAAPDRKSQVNIISSDHLPQFYKFSLPQNAESLRIASAAGAAGSFGEVDIILRQRKIIQKRTSFDERPLPKTGL